MPFDRRGFLASALVFAASARSQQGARPNVLIVLSDQESQKVPRELLRLPNRERIERHGVAFDNCWCATPQCSPARAALWTGRWPHATGVVANIGAAGAAPLSPEIPALGQVFRAAGYRTGYFGKWHLSEGRAVAGEAFGYEVFRERGDESGDAGVARAAAGWIAPIAGGSTPWLAVVSLIQPHDVYEYPNVRAKLAAEGKSYPIRPGTPAPPGGPADLATRPQPQQAYREQDQGQPVIGYDAAEWRRYRSLYYDLIEDADRHLGVVLDAAGSALDNTIVVYTSDHGDGQGAHGLPFKGPFFYEELLNVPLVVSWAALGRTVARSSELASHVDLLPTLCDLAGVAPPAPLDGASLRPAMEGHALGREAVFAEYHSKQRWPNPARIVRTRRWKLAAYFDGGRELYDLERDPDEVENLAGRGLEAERELLARLDGQAARTTDARWFGRREARG